MRVRAAVAAGVAGLCVAPPAEAAPVRTLRIVDIADDSNVLNEQGVCETAHTNGGPPCPAELTHGQGVGNVEPAADIRSVTVSTLWATKMRLGAAPEPGVGYALYMNSAACTSYNLYFAYYVERPQETELGQNCGGSTVWANLEPAEVRGSALIITISAADAYVEPGTVFDDIDVMTRVRLVARRTRAVPAVRLRGHRAAAPLRLISPAKGAGSVRAPSNGSGRRAFGGGFTMRVHAAVAAALAGLCLASPAEAAPVRTVRIVDIKDDANFVNDQFVCLMPEARGGAACGREVTHGQPYGNVEPAADIRTVTATTTYETKRVRGRGGRTVTTRKVSGFKVVAELGAAPKAGVVYGYSMDTAGCETYIVYFRWYVGRPQQTELSHTCGGEPVWSDLEPPEITGSTMTITVSAEDAFVDPGTVFDNIFYFTRVPTWTPTGALQLPQYDYADTTQQFRYG